MKNWKVGKVGNTEYAYIEMPKSELDINKTLNCGQAFRWIWDKQGFWYSELHGKLVVLAQGKTNNKECLVTNILDSEGLKQIEHYLDMDIEYTIEVKSLDLDKYASSCAKLGEGIHILNQDLLEMMITFLMSQFNSMNNIRLIINKLTKKNGQRVSTVWLNNELEAYTFPSLEQLSCLTVDDFQSYSMGFRSQYLYSMITKLYKSPSILDEITKSKNPRVLLKQFDGIGDKVANCIALFALHDLKSFPIDTHIKRIINREYNGNIDISRYGNIAGLIQQYMYYSEAFINKE